MRKLRFLVLLMTLLIVGVMTPNLEAHAETADKLIVHYHRFDPNYAPWKLWLWQTAPVDGNGADYAFNGTDEFGVYMELDLAGSALEGATESGVIVKTSTWEKDVAIDRFINLTNPDINGEVHVYLVSGDATIYYDDAGIDISNRVLQVDFQTTSRITFSASKDVLESDVQVLADGTPVSIDTFSMSGGAGTIELTNEADLGKTYTLVVDFGDTGVDPKEYTIGFAGLYASDAFNDQYAYDGDLGAMYSETSTTFKLWAPLSSAVSLNLYDYGHQADETDYYGQAGTDTPYAEYDLVKEDKGVWTVTVDGDLHGVYYTYNVTNGSATNEASDPYAVSAGVNGRRSMVVDFDRLDPEGWVEGYRPDTIETYNDSVITEIHVRDYTTHESWNGTDAYRGKFLGLVESGTTYGGYTTGFDHIVELGVTHVQLLPVFDYGAAVDETRLLDPTYTGVADTIFNWGYMPENYNVVEGSYSTDPYDGSVRVTEYKELVQAFSDEDIRIVMDVVYNHHGKSADSNFDLIVPGYYFRLNENGSFSNGSGTGNETASEHYMMRKFMVDSVTFWAEEYNISGFRFDLMKLHDVDTMNAIVDALHEIDPTILVYGEPWTGGTSPLPEEDSAYNGTLDEMPGVAVFNDDTRDGIKGSVFDAETPGFIQGVSSFEFDERIKLGIVGGVAHKNIAVAALPKGAWALNPNQTVNYATAHDNNVLYDKIMLSTDDVSYAEVQHMVEQAGAILLTSNGIPFLHGGIEILRSKECTIVGGVAQGECEGGYDHNSYRSPDETNQINWQWKVDNIEVFNYYKGLIEIRKAVPNFSYDSLEEMNQKMYFFPDSSGMVSYIIYDAESPWEYTLVAHNNAVVERPLDLQGMEWNLVVNSEFAGLETLDIVSGTYTLAPNESVVMYIPNANVAFLPDVFATVLDGIEDVDYSSENPFDEEAITQSFKDELGDDITVTFDNPIDYAVTDIYKVTVTVTDSFGNTQNQILDISVIGTSSSSNLLVIIGSIVGGIIAIGAAVLFFFRKSA